MKAFGSSCWFWTENVIKPIGTGNIGKGELSMVWGELDDTIAVHSTLLQQFFYFEATIYVKKYSVQYVAQ